MSASWKQLFFHILLLLISCGHIDTKTPGPTPPPQEPSSPLPKDVRSVVLKGNSHTEKIQVLNPVNMTLECTWAGNLVKPLNLSVFWTKDGEDIENSHSTVVLKNQQYNLQRGFMIEKEESLGNYSCVFGNEAKIDFILAAPLITDVRDKPIVTYIGDTAVIVCKMDDKQPKPSTWHWFKENATEKEQIDVQAEPHRYEIKIKENESRLLVHNLTQADSGLYYCGAVYAISTTMSHVELKVITFYEPLKPFAAILVEVIILVAAILLYEKSLSKKSNKGGDKMNADQPNTPTQGENNGLEESSSMRQRKV
ncbi:embigin [Aulostomus maculatus]